MNWFGSRAHRFRLATVLLLFLGMVAAVVFRLISLQVLDADRLVAIAERQHQHSVTVTGRRGNIYDRNGEELAATISMKSVFAQPSLLKNRKKAAAELAKKLSISRKEILRKLNSDQPFVWIKRKVSPQVAEKVQALDIAGIGLMPEHKRFYPHHAMTSHVLGFAGMDSQGLEGLELHYDRYLRGQQSVYTIQRDGKGRRIADPKGKRTRGGSDIILTIDRSIQYISYKELSKAIAEKKAKEGVIIVMDPRTGEVLAMAGVPSFDPNRIIRGQVDDRRNRAVTDFYEPGSTFKVFLAAAHIEEGMWKPDELFYCEKGRYRVGRRIIHDVKKHEWLNLSEIMKVSSNIGASKISARLGRERFYQYIRRFGFGDRTHLDFPGEVSGLVRSPKNWSEIGLNNIAFGQGIGVTPLQLTNAFCTIANDGKLLRPYLVRKIQDDQGRVIQEFSPTFVRRVISPSTAAVLTNMLRGVVEEGGTGMKAAVEGYDVAGKTGTAQVVDPETGTYSPDRYMSSFIGFAPASDPAVAVLVIIQEPEGRGFGGQVAAPVFHNVMLHTLRYLGIPPEEKEEQEVPGLVARASYSGNEDKMKKTTSKEEGSSGVMPDVIGMSMREVVAQLQKINVEFEMIGSGRAVSQKPSPHRSLDRNQRCTVVFRPPGKE